MLPARWRDRVDGALSGYTRATIAVAVVDAVLIGAGLAILGVPMVIPLAALVFVGAFVPVVGAFVAGFVAVQELEGDVLQPFLLGRIVRLHPLVVVFAVATGVVLAFRDYERG